jgi:peptidoglycan/xylan/chitin deacetylase (PgdA/CDA1 family)
LSRASPARPLRPLRRLFALALLALLVTLAVQPPFASETVARGASGILFRVRTDQPLVALTFDDGPDPTYTPQVLDTLARDKVQATFFLVGRRARARPDLVARIRQDGHEIGNHTMAHPCSRAFRESAEPAGLEALTLEALEADIVETERRLREAIPEQQERSFCYPCYQDFVGEGETRQSYVPLIARHFIAARAKGEVANHPASCTLHHLSSFPVERCWGPTLVGLAERAATQGRWTILTFHGVNQGHLTVSEVDLKELSVHLQRRRERIWTAPVIEVARRIVEWRGR